MAEIFVLGGWAVAVFGAFLVVVCVLALVRGLPEGRSAPFVRVAALLAAALAGSIIIDQLIRQDRAGDRRTLDARARELAARTIMPGSALACLDAMAGEAVESSCEKALFATPEATAAAVSYVAAQLSLLAAGLEYARRVDASYQSKLANVRHALERDRFGIVAHVLAVRDRCTPAQCAAFELLHDARRVRANMAGRSYESLIERHAASWAPADPAIAAHAPAASLASPAPPAAPEAPPAAVAAAKPPSRLFFPSASSIPAVNIMSAEPSAPAADGSEPVEGAGPPIPPRKPQGRPANSAGGRAAPLPLVPGGP